MPQPKHIDSNQPQIGVVVVAYKSEIHIEKCIRSILEDPGVTSIIVVDNSSSKETHRICDDLLAGLRVQYADPGSNVGFGRGCNWGAGFLPSGLSHVAFVNPDLYLVRRLSDLVPTLERTGACIAAGRLVPALGEKQTNATPKATASREIMRSAVGSIVYHGRPFPSSAEVIVGVLAGALLVMPTSHFHALGGFDEQFELYYEDGDLARRAVERGGSVLVNADWGVHIGGESYSRSEDTAYRVLRVSRIRYLRKYYGMTGGTLAAAFSCFLEALTRIVTRQPEGPAVVLRGVKDQLRELAHPRSVSCLISK